LNQLNDNRCPRVAFVEDITIVIKEFQEAGDHIILLIDGNTNMRHSNLATAFSNQNLKEAL
jgi:hypothetical protein